MLDTPGRLRCNSAMPDLIECVEAAYSLEGDEAQWLLGLSRTYDHLFRLAPPPLAFTFECTPTRFTFGQMATCGPAQLQKWALALLHAARPEAIDRVYRSGEPVGCLSEQVFPAYPEQRQAMQAATSVLVRDVVGMTGHTGTGAGVSVGAALGMARSPRAHERRQWTLLASHLGAGLRLRRSLQAHQDRPGAAAAAHDSPLAEAVLHPDGRLLHATPATQEAGIRERLHHAVRHMDKARSRQGRQDAEASLNAWTALVEGQWSLVDRFEADGRRFVVAMRNDPQHPDPRGLTQRERQVADCLGRGQNIQTTAYALGLSPSAIVKAADLAQHKLGLASRLELAAFFSPNGPSARLADIGLGDEQLLVASEDLVDLAQLAQLTTAERAVATALLEGATLADIALKRSTSERTVANQVQAIYRKLGVGSRLELAMVLQARR
jgi:DNA-binding NarL/FixJ family response regulator